jgi:hypothetical protein
MYACRLFYVYEMPTRTIRRSLLTFFPMPRKKKEGWKEETSRKRKYEKTT